MKSRLVVCALLAGCFRSATPGPQHAAQVVPAPKALQPRPLEVGQWAIYRERDAHGDVGMARFVAVVASSCGVWVRVDLSRSGEHRRWIVCMGTDPGRPPRARIAEALIDDGSPRTVDLANPGTDGPELDAIATRLAAPDMSGAFGREDVTVPAGRFEQALRADDATSTTWLHPSVPFAGAVKIVDGHGRQDVLAHFGDGGLEAADAFSHDGGAFPPHRPFVAAGPGYSLQAAYGTVAGGGSAGLAAIGLHATRALDVVSAMTVVSEELWTLGAGVRWFPLNRTRSTGVTFDPYVQGAVGYARAHETAEDVGGVAATASAGWLTSHGAWGVAVQLDLVGARFPNKDAAAGALGLLVQLELP